MEIDSLKKDTASDGKYGTLAVFHEGEKKAILHSWFTWESLELLGIIFHEKKNSTKSKHLGQVDFEFQTKEKI